jgi:hypothetical protein
MCIDLFPVNIKMSVFDLLILLGGLELLWPNSYWLMAYQVVAFSVLMFALVAVVVSFVAIRQGGIESRNLVGKTKFRIVNVIRIIGVLSIAWLLEDCWAWWFTVLFVAIFLVLRLMTKVMLRESAE